MQISLKILALYQDLQVTLFPSGIIKPRTLAAAAPSIRDSVNEDG